MSDENKDATLNQSMDTLLDDAIEVVTQEQSNEINKIAYQLQIPEGMSLNEAQQAIFEEQARTLGLDNDKAQKLLELAHKNATQFQNAHKNQVSQWKDAVQQDGELGGSAMQSTIAYAKAGLTRFDPDHNVLNMLKETGYANNPHVIRFLAAIGKAHAEDNILLGETTKATAPRHERMYGKYNQ